MKKAQSEPAGGLSTAVKLLLVLLSVGVMILIIFYTGLLAEGHTIFCAYITRMSALIRGIIVSGVVGAVGSVMLLFSGAVGVSPKCFNPAGAVKCGIIIAAGNVIIFAFISSFASSVPFFSCNLPPATIGTRMGQSSIENFQTKLADATLDCYYMYTAGEYNPLFGKTPPNPKNCQIIRFDLEDGVTLQELVDFMSSEKTVFKEGRTYTFDSNNAELFAESIIYPEVTDVKRFATKSRLISTPNGNFNMSVYYNEHGDICGESFDGWFIDVCLTNISDPSDSECFCNLGHPGTSRSFELQSVPMYFTMRDQLSSSVRDSCVNELSDPNNFVLCGVWDIAIYIGEHTYESYMIGIDNALNYRFEGSEIDEGELASKTIYRGNVVVAYKDYWSYWFMDKPSLTNVECGITSSDSFSKKDEVFWCFFDLDTPFCTTPDENVCIDNPRSGEADYEDRRHEYIGYCNTNNRTVDITSCSNDFCSIDPSTGICKKDCSCRYNAAGVAGCYKENTFESCVKIGDCAHLGDVCLTTPTGAISETGPFKGECKLVGDELWMDWDSVLRCVDNYDCSLAEGICSCMPRMGTFVYDFNCRVEKDGIKYPCTLSTCTPEYVCVAMSKCYKNESCEIEDCEFCPCGCDDSGDSPVCNPETHEPGWYCHSLPPTGGRKLLNSCGTIIDFESCPNLCNYEIGECYP